MMNKDDFEIDLTDRFYRHVWSSQNQMLALAHDLVCNLACLAERPGLFQLERGSTKLLHQHWTEILNLIVAVVTETQSGGVIVCWSCQRILARRSARGKRILEADAYLRNEDGRQLIHCGNLACRELTVLLPIDNGT